MNMSPQDAGAGGLPLVPRLAKITGENNDSVAINHGYKAVPVQQEPDVAYTGVSEDATQSNDEVLTEEIDLSETSSVDDSVNTAVIPEPVSQMAREIADGIKLAFDEYRPKLKELVFEVYEEMTGKKPEKPDPDIEYSERQHWLKFGLQLLIPILLFVVGTVMYVWLTDKLFATIPAVVILAIVFWFGVRYLARKQENSAKTEKKKMHILFVMFGCGIAVLVLCVGIAFILELLGVSFAWSVVYLMGCAALVYYSYRLHYMWSQLWFTRDGGVIHASRPENTVYFLPTFNKDLFLENVNDANDAQTWPEEVLGIYRIHISLDAEMPDKKEDPLGYQNAKFWRRLSFIVNGAQLRAAIKQGAQYRRR